MLASVGGGGGGVGGDCSGSGANAVARYCFPSRVPETMTRHGIPGTSPRLLVFEVADADDADYSKMYFGRPITCPRGSKAAAIAANKEGSVGPTANEGSSMAGNADAKPENSKRQDCASCNPSYPCLSVYERDLGRAPKPVD